jgi:hypothetical protein
MPVPSEGEGLRASRRATPTRGTADWSSLCHEKGRGDSPRPLWSNARLVFAEGDVHHLDTGFAVG